MATSRDIEGGKNGAHEKEEAREPLVRKNSDEGSDAYNDKRGSSSMVYLSTFIAVCGSYAFGACAGFSSPTQDAITEDLSLTLSEERSQLDGLLITSAEKGLVRMRYAARQYPIMHCIAGWLAIYFAEGVWPLDIGRLANGYGMGAFSYVVPIFIAEIAPKSLRGALTTLNQVMICCGVSVAFIIGTVLSWRVLALTGLVPCAVVVFGLFFIPESPRWLAKVGRDKDFEAALQKLRGKDADISTEATEIRVPKSSYSVFHSNSIYYISNVYHVTILQDYIETLERLPKAKLLDLFQRRYIPSVTIGVGLMVAQQFGGINGVCFYTSNIFESAGFPSRLGTIIYAIIQVVVTTLNTLVIDKAGRKPLLLVSGLGLVVACVITALSFFLKVHEIALDAVPILAVVGILLYIGSFSAGMGAVPWVVMSEIFPINIKGTAGSLATMVNWFGAWAISFTFNFLISWSSYGTFLIYAAINALAIIFIVKVVPETKGKTLEQIQAAING